MRKLLSAITVLTALTTASQSYAVADKAMETEELASVIEIFSYARTANETRWITIANLQACRDYNLANALEASEPDRDFRQAIARLRAARRLRGDANVVALALHTKRDGYIDGAFGIIRNQHLAKPVVEVVDACMRAASMAAMLLREGK